MFLFSDQSKGSSDTTVHVLCRKSSGMRYGCISWLFTGPVKNRQSLESVTETVNITYEYKDMVHNK